MSEKPDAIQSRTIKVDYLARVEGEGSMHVKMKGNRVEEVRLGIFEPPRFFEALLRGRQYTEVPDITARICGICPVAYQMSSVGAMEEACGVEVTGPLRDLRRMLYCGEWIESHALHIFMLHAPDFLGYESALEMAADHGPLVETALRIKKAGNALVTLVGGREIHPINVKVGGFYHVPKKRELMALRDELAWARDATLESIGVLAGFEFPDFDRDYEFVSMRHENEYPMAQGRLVSSSGLDIPVADYEEHFVEEHVPHSNALHSRMKGKGSYFVGPSARMALNFDKLSPAAQEAAKGAGIVPGVANPFRSIVVRAVELFYALEESVRLIEAYERPDAPSVEVTPRAGVGHGCTEAPRGILYHRYRIDDDGSIQSAKIVPPTSQNQPTIEEDLKELVQKNHEMEHDALRWMCEQAIRNYDPCISCATHFLELDIERA